MLTRPTPRTYVHGLVQMRLKRERIERETDEWCAALSNRQLLMQFRDLIEHHAWVLPCTQGEPFLYLGDPVYPNLIRTEIEIGCYVTAIVKRKYSISKIF